MQYRRLGTSGLQLSALSFGAWVTFGNQVGRSAARELIALAWDNGINFFDNAESCRPDVPRRRYSMGGLLGWRASVTTAPEAQVTMPSPSSGE